MPTGTPTKSKKCAICGKEFVPKSPAQRICSDNHYSPCPVCGKPVLWNTTSKNVTPCCKECSRILRRKKSMEKYGVEHPMQLKEVQEKHKASVKAHFGVEHPLQCQELKDKAVQTNREKFGTDWALGNREFHEKCFDTMEKKYGYRTSFESPELMAKARETMIRKYGVDNPRKIYEVDKRIRTTCSILYGSENPMQNTAIASKAKRTRLKNNNGVFWTQSMNDKAVATNMKRYGTDNASKSEVIKERIRKSCMDKYGVPYGCMVEGAKPQRISKLNKKFQQYLAENNIESTLEVNIGNKFFDLYIPSCKTVVEIDPSYTHNTEGCNHFNHKIPLDYHISKTQIAVQNGYRCIHVFDWDDWDKVIQLVTPTKRIYARQCQLVKVVDDKVANKFIKENHLQGQARGALLTLGLAYNDELVQCMSFGLSRYNKNYTYELLRLCSKQGVSVLGGASKMFKFATQQLELDSIISYCDASKFTGKVYEAMGMTRSKLTAPSIIWSKEEKRITSNLLRQRGYDQLFNANYGKGTDNELLMLFNGWVPVPDCGQYVFTYQS